MTATRATDLEALGRFVASIHCDGLPGAIVRKAQACLLYGLAIGAAGARAPQPQQAARAADLESAAGADGATRILDGRKLPFALAAFCNGALLHARVQDDSHPAGHFGTIAIPAALACAQRFSASGSDLLAALVAGYEVALRIGRDHAADLSMRGFRTTPVYGVFAAAACGARLMKLDATGSAHALALAASGASGLREWMQAGSGEQQFQVGIAARNGLTCAALAACGGRGAISALTGGKGFYQAFGRSDTDYAHRLTAALGESFEFESVEYKPYPISQFVRAVVRGVLALRSRAGERPLRGIAVRMHPFEADFPGNRFAGPFVAIAQSLASTPFCAALAWSTGELTFSGLQSFDDRRVQAVVPRVSVIADPACARYSPHIAVTLEDGTRLDTDETASRQSYDLTWDAAVRMNAALAAETGIGADRTDALRRCIEGIVSAECVDPLLQATTGCVPPL